MDRMGPLDAEFLHIEDGVSHMHIAGCSLFEGPPPPFGDILEWFASKLPDLPRYRQVVRFVPLGLGRPVWVDDPHFNLQYHVRHTALPEPGDEEALCRLVGRLMSQELDRNRPLWEAWVVEGLTDDRWAIVSKVHHCLADGISGTDLMAALLDESPDAEIVPPPPWRPEPEPSGSALVLDAFGGLIGDVTDRARMVPDLVRDPRRIVADLRSTASGLLALGERMAPTPPTSIDGPIGPHRRWAATTSSLAEIKEVRRGLAGTVNDVVLAVITRGFRDLIESRGEDPERLTIRTLVPVSVRAPDQHGVPDNRVSAIFAELPVAIPDPVSRLEAIKSQMADLKDSHQADAGEVLTTLGVFAPPMLLSFGTHSIVRYMTRRPQRSINTVTTNVPGPQYPLYALGREMLEYHPFVPLAQGVRVGVAILSYNGKVSFGVTGDFDTAPDIDVLCRGIDEGLAELLALVRPSGSSEVGPSEAAEAGVR